MDTGLTFHDKVNGREPLLRWDFDGCGEWTAHSDVPDSDGDKCYQYSIQVCSDGTFAVSDSPGAIAKDTTTKASLALAVEICEAYESVLRGQGVVY
jgi:hypothetical protein